MSLYIDTSCLWKLLVAEVDSAKVYELVYREPEVVVSTFAELEAEQLLLALRLGGLMKPRQYTRTCGVLAGFRGLDPFRHRSVIGDLAQISRNQILRSPSYCRTPDRLHLAAMEALGVRRLLTNDNQQAAAAQTLGFEVLFPR